MWLPPAASALISQGPGFKADLRFKADVIESPSNHFPVSPHCAVLKKAQKPIKYVLKFRLVSETHPLLNTQLLRKHLID